MNMIPRDKPILVPVDFSVHSEKALLLAAELADKIDSSIVVVHVVHDPGESPGYYSIKGRHKVLSRMEDVAKDMLDDFLKKFIKSHPDLKKIKKAKHLLVTGLPVDRILQMVKKFDASMIIMGSRGRTRLSHILLGSKAEQVIRLSPIPVTITKVSKVSKVSKQSK